MNTSKVGVFEQDTSVSMPVTVDLILGVDSEATLCIGDLPTTGASYLGPFHAYEDANVAAKAAGYSSDKPALMFVSVRTLSDYSSHLLNGDPDKISPAASRIALGTGLFCGLRDPNDGQVLALVMTDSYLPPSRINERAEKPGIGLYLLKPECLTQRLEEKAAASIQNYL